MYCCIAPTIHHMSCSLSFDPYSLLDHLTMCFTPHEVLYCYNYLVEFLRRLLPQVHMHFHHLAQSYNTTTQV
jgi:hypothetical protein